MWVDYKVLGERIKTQRKIKGTTQEHFAEHLNVSVGYISQIERGITRVSLERLIEISRYLGCGIDFCWKEQVRMTKNILQMSSMNCSSSYRRLKRKC